MFTCPFSGVVIHSKASGGPKAEDADIGAKKGHMVWTNYLRGLLTIGLRLICYIICLLACVLLPNDVLSLTEVLTFYFIFSPYWPE